MYQFFLPLNKDDLHLYNSRDLIVYWPPPLFSNPADGHSANNMQIGEIEYDFKSRDALRDETGKLVFQTGGVKANEFDYSQLKAIEIGYRPFDNLKEEK